MTEFEKNASAATELPSFSINISDVRRLTHDLLQEFGRYGMFNEYTKHDYSHIHEIMTSLDWIIPHDCRHSLSKGDVFLIVTSLYLHDLGLLVTREEFENRDKDNIQKFAEADLFYGIDGIDYKAKLDGLGSEDREKFIYSEYVRRNHGSRVRSWIEGTHTNLKNHSVVAELNKVLLPLNERVRRDIAMLCESHNLDDLSDINKYKISRSYGNSEDETVNLLYCAIIIRTADLLQITSKRAPSALFRVINPTDPVSQLEWIKQNAVTRVKSKPGKDEDGNLSEKIYGDTIDVFAEFKLAEGYFGLTSYLAYAQDQIEKSFNYIEKNKKNSTRKYHFPWRKIDYSNIEADGFKTEKYNFTLDQGRILTLLTGHTLYNDSSVAIRELLQNALDAVRYQCALTGADSSLEGKIKIHWNSKSREITVIDNGTGMTQQVIEDHFLKVGSSRYQDDDFRKENPDFYPISRFGIGVLSAFMIADEVEITTCAEDEPEARLISLRTVHGRYLMRLYNKNDIGLKANVTGPLLTCSILYL